MTKQLIALLMIAACSGTNNSQPADATLARECASRCNTKLTTCGATPAQTAQACPYICGMSPTEPQMQCLETKPCFTDVSSALQECGVGVVPPGGDAGTQKDAAMMPDAKPVCVEAGAIRYVCKCSAGLEVRGCTKDPANVCMAFCPIANCNSGAMCYPE